MRDLILQCAGVAGIAVALIHGVLGETKVFARATIQPESLRTLIRLVWQAGTVAWIGGGVLLIAAPSFGSESARHWIVVTIVVLRYCGAKSSPKLGRLSVPACFFACQAGDSGRNGRMIKSGSAGISPDISV